MTCMAVPCALGQIDAHAGGFVTMEYAFGRDFFFLIRERPPEPRLEVFSRLAKGGAELLRCR